MLVFYLLKGKTTEEHIAEVTEGVKDVVGNVVGALEIMNQPQESKTFLVDVLIFDKSFFFWLGFCGWTTTRIKSVSFCHGF